MIRVGVIGLGVMGRNHARVLASMPGVELAGLYDAFLGTSQAIHGVTVENDFDTFLATDFDYVVVSSPTATHLEYGLALASRGVNALIEKPLAASVNEAKLLIEAFDGARLICAVGHIERFNPALQAMKKKIDEGLIGEIIQITTRRQGPFPGRIADVGVVKDLASHDIDLTAWIANSRYKIARGELAYRSGRTHEDSLIAVGQLENGVLVSHIVNWLSPFKERQTAVLGEKGLLVADTLAVDLTFSQNGNVTSSWEVQTQFRGVTEGDITRFALERKEPLLSEHVAMIDAVTTSSKSGIVSLQDGLEVLRIAEMLIGQNSNE